MTETATQPVEPVEGEVLEAAQVPLSTSSGVALARPTEPPGREVLMPADASQVIEGMKAYQSLLHELLDDTDWQSTGEGRFPKKSAWRKIARAFNLSVEIVSIHVERDADGKPERAECIARAIAPNGQVQDADGYCTLSEFTGRRADDVKLENTLRATATTRAKNRAIADLVGMGEVSAEEVSDAGHPTGPTFKRADEAERKAAMQALGRLASTPEAARDIWTKALRSFDDLAPAGLCVLLIELAADRGATDG
jgi:hypothetical protein